MKEPSEEEILKFIPILKQTNPLMSHEELKVLAKKLLSSPLGPEDSEQFLEDNVPDNEIK